MPHQQRTAVTFDTTHSFQPIYRLRGEIDGQTKIFEVQTGEHRVGRGADCDLNLRAGGVSRYHSVLRVTDEGLEVEDHQSRNGTWLDGLRIERAAVPEGSELRFGPLSFEVHSVEAEDVEIALDLADALATGSPEPSGPKARILPWTGPGSNDATEAQIDRSAVLAEVWWEALERTLCRVAENPSADLTGTMKALVGALGASGGCVAEWPADGELLGEPLIVASAGNLSELPERHDLHGGSTCGCSRPPMPNFWRVAPRAAFAAISTSG